MFLKSLIPFVLGFTQTSTPENKMYMPMTKHHTLNRFPHNMYINQNPKERTQSSLTNVQMVATFPRPLCTPLELDTALPYVNIVLNVGSVAHTYVFDVLSQVVTSRRSSGSEQYTLCAQYYIWITTSRINPGAVRRIGYSRSSV